MVKVILIVFMLLPICVNGQDVQNLNMGMDLEKLGYTVDSGKVGDSGFFSYMNYGKNALIDKRDSSDKYLINHLNVIGLVLNYGLIQNKLQVGGDIGYGFSNGLGGKGLDTGGGLNSIKLNMKADVLKVWGVNIGFGVVQAIPVINSRNVGEGFYSIIGKMILGYEIGKWQMGGNIGVRGRMGEKNEYSLGGGVIYSVGVVKKSGVLDMRLEVYGRYFWAESVNPMEILLSGRKELDGLYLDMGIGKGLTGDYSAVDYRLVVSLGGVIGSGDRDNDGVMDKWDRCVNQKEDGRGVMEGCPEIDSDNDGIVDMLDRCPMEGEDGKGVIEGCPKNIDQEDIVLSDTVYFERGTANILPKSYKLFEKVVSLLNKNSLMRLVVVCSGGDLTGDRCESIREGLNALGLGDGRVVVQVEIGKEDKVSFKFIKDMGIK